MSFSVPWKETLLIFLLVSLSISINTLHFKEGIVKNIARHPIVQFFIVYLSAFLIISLNIETHYPLIERIIVATIVATAVQFILLASTIPHKFT